MARNCTHNDAEQIINLMCSTDVPSCAKAAESIGVSPETAYTMLRQDRYRARYESAKLLIADRHNDNALQHIYNIDDNATQAAVTRQKELAQFSMRMAGVIDKERYGKSATITHNTNSNSAMIEAAASLQALIDARDSASAGDQSDEQ